MIGLISFLLLAAAAPASAPHGPAAELQDARTATHRLDECLQRTTDRLIQTRLSWREKYVAYFQSCATERHIMFEKTLAYEWAYHRPRDQSERLNAFDIAKTRVEDRYEIWTKLLDPAPVMD